MRKKQRTRWHEPLCFAQIMDLDCGWSPPVGEFEQSRAAMFGFLTLDDARAAWEAHKEDEIFNRHLVDDPAYFEPGRRCWAWWKFDAPEEPREGESQVQCLARLGLLTANEKAHLTRNLSAKDVESFNRPAELAFLQPIEEE